jgi:hypothetical protein
MRDIPPDAVAATDGTPFFLLHVPEPSRVGDEFSALI